MTRKGIQADGCVRKARIADAEEIHSLISYFAERHRMLFRSMEDLYEKIREFRVFVDSSGAILGCCALTVMWRDLAEVRSLAVDAGSKGMGIGRQLVEHAIAEAGGLGIEKVFALTYEDEFFKRLGFKVISKDLLPHKVWTDCIRCPMKDDCREIAVEIEIGKNDE